MVSEWKEAVASLANQVKGWVSKDRSTSGSMALHDLTMDPTADEPLLQIEVNGTERLYLEPAAFAAGRLPTNVYLYAYPTLRRAVLFGPDKQGNWEIQSSEGVPMNYAWDSDGFLHLVRALVENHVPRSV